MKVKTSLSMGNHAFRNFRYHEAIEFYKKAKKEKPYLSKTVEFNLEYLKKITKEISNVNKSEETIKKLPITALVITWDVAHNPLGRSYMLAEVLDRVVKNVILSGFHFEKFGKLIWEPVRKGKIPIITLRGSFFPELSSEFEKIIEKFKPDIVFSCKPRLPSIQLGAMFKDKYNIPLVIDIDDYELSFSKDKTQIKVDDFIKLGCQEISKYDEPYSDLWTQLSNDLIKFADYKIVSNVALKEKFGGEIIPHVRDETVFDASLYNKFEMRLKYDIPINAKVLMFFGTPRHHKGVRALAEAVGKIKDDDFLLVIVGTATDRSVTKDLSSLAKGKLISIPNQPFSSIPEVIRTSDIICLPQDEKNETSKYQLPAKAIDAIAMGVPLLVSNTKPLMQLVDDGVAIQIDPSNLVHDLETHMNNAMSSKGTKTSRRIFIEKYSYRSAALKLEKLIQNALSAGSNLVEMNDLRDLISYQKKAFDFESDTYKKNGIDIVMFWKQHDSTLYGRRNDMMMKYLSLRDDVRKIVLIEPPVSEYDLNKMREDGRLSQSRSVYVNLCKKMLSQFDSKKIDYNFFLHKPGIYSNDKSNLEREYIFKDYSKYLEEVFKRNDISPNKTIFWFYPKNYLSKEIIEYFEPKNVVVDVVDDHRAWPNTSKLEKEKLTEHYRELLSISDFSMANCLPVIDSMKEFDKNIKLITNGCDNLRRVLIPDDCVYYEKIKEFDGKVIGFVGNLESKIDIELLNEVSDVFSNDLVVLIGSTHANPEAKTLSEKSNIIMVGVVDYKYINAYVSLFDVGLVPHKIMPLTKNMNPLKVYVYAANYVPIVATAVENIENESFIHKSNTNKEFIENIGYILSYPPKKYDYTEFLERNSWSKKVNDVMEELA